MAASIEQIIRHKLRRYPYNGICKVLNVSFDMPTKSDLPYATSSSAKNFSTADTFISPWGQLTLDDFIHIFGDIELDMSILCLNAYTFVAAIEGHTKLDARSYDLEPYKLFLQYLAKIVSLIDLTITSLRDVSNLWRRCDMTKLKVNWESVFAEKALVNPRTKSSVSFETYPNWRFSIPHLPIVDMDPISSRSLLDLIGFPSMKDFYECLRALAQFRGNKRSKKFMNLDTNLGVIQPTWSKMTFHNKDLLICSQNEARFALIKAILLNKFMTDYFNGELSIVLTPEKLIKKTKATEPEVDRKYKSVPKSTREEVWLRDNGNIMRGGKCFCCHRTIDHATFHAGHIISDKHGGLPVPDNLKAVCITCNQDMRTQNMKEYCAEKFPHIHHVW